MCCTVAMIRHFCSRVRAIVTDMGVERKLADMVDCIDEFMLCHDPKYRDLGPADRVSHLFPRALQMGGWKHIWDGLIQKGLCSLRFLPCGWTFSKL